jgi:hypothetical protein
MPSFSFSISLIKSLFSITTLFKIKQNSLFLAVFLPSPAFSQAS